MVNLTNSKFKENGDFNTFRGNTVVANLYTNETLMEVVNYIQGEYRKLPFIHKFTLTPNGSIHMTVMELLCDQNRRPEYWSKELSLDLPIDDVSDYFGEKLTDFPLENEKIVMKTTAMGDQNLLVEPADEESAQRLVEVRSYIAEKTGVQFPNHFNYQFHISIGYLRIPLSEEERQYFERFKSELSKYLLDKLPTIEIKRIDYTVFEDMTKFVPYTK